MSTLPLPEADTIWDVWCAARNEAPQLSAESFADRYAERRDEVLDLLLALLAVEEQAPLPSLVRVLRPGVDGDLRFAGFRLLHELGEGSAGIVFEAIDERESGTGDHVALKILNPVLGGGRTQREGILREAEITQRLEHPSIVRVLGSDTEQGYAWIATELLEGDSLGQWIDGPASPAERTRNALEFGLQIAQGLEHAHGRGVLHRDLKPANVMVDAGRKVKLLDFGLARREGAAFGVSHTGDVVGTPLYMAPEQLRGMSDLDGRADLYALGLMMLELATGKRLLLRTDALKIMAGIAQGSGRLSSRYFSGLPRDLAGVLSRCLEPDRRDRYACAHALIGDLEALRDTRRPRLGRLSFAARLTHAIVRRPVRCAAILGLLSCMAYGVQLAIGHMPLTVTIDSIMARPAEVLVDGERVNSNLPLTLSFWKRGVHSVEFFDGIYRYPFEIDVRDSGPRSFFLPNGRIYPEPQPLIPLLEEVPGKSVAFVQLGVRAADHEDHHQSLRVRLSGVPRIDHAVGGFSTFPLEVREEPYLLHIESDGFRPRDVPLLARDGRTRSVMVELDRVDSPWHTVLVGNPLDPQVEAGLVRSDNLTLRWEDAQRDSYTDGFVHRVGLGVVDGTREGSVEFRIPLPCAVEELQLLAFVNPEITGVTHPGQAILVEMGPSADRMIPVFEWFDFPGADVDLGYGINEPARARLSRLMKEAGATELHVRYSAVGEAAWLLRSNALPRRTRDGGVHWEPTLIFRVRPPGTAGDTCETYSLEELAGRPKAQRVIDLATDRGVVTFKVGAPGEFEPFAGERLRFNLVFGSDLDGDGIGDFALVIGDKSQRLEIRSGRDGSPLLELTGDPGDQFGHSIVFVPDMDGDGLDDLLIGAPQGSQSASGGPGYLRLVSGKTGTTLCEKFGERLRGGFGWSADLVGDLDGQGNYAVIASTLEREAGGWGSAKLLSLPGLEELAHFQGREQFDFFGTICAAAGDVNADGIPDMLIGSVCEETPVWDGGAVYVYSGDAAQGFPLLQRVQGTAVWEKLGEGIGRAGDVDGDGHEDWLATHSPWFTTVHSGRTGRVLHAFPGGAAHVRASGAMPRLVSDLDGDGLFDIAVPRHEAVAGGPSAGVMSSVVFSAASGEPLLELRVPGSLVPLNLTRAPDLDGDGREDLLVGLGLRAGRERPQLLFVLSGGM